ncbi:alpha-protein kinase 2 isoform 1-T2 [Leptodactylus fuscus]|uniref:alpha-protein kinase 2 n=1 Tax=Leptodactylus fuscus TaxID=238119 RepID=UPI003F4EC825
MGAGESLFILEKDKKASEHSKLDVEAEKLAKRKNGHRNGDFKGHERVICHTGSIDHLYCMWHGSKYCCRAPEPKLDTHRTIGEDFFDDCLNYLECFDVMMDYENGTWQHVPLGKELIFLLEDDQDDETKVSRDCLNECDRLPSGVTCTNEGSNNTVSMDASTSLCVSHSEPPRLDVKGDFPGDNLKALQPEMVITVGHQEDNTSSLKRKERCKLPLSAIQDEQAGIDEDSMENSLRGDVSTCIKAKNSDPYMELYLVNVLDNSVTMTEGSTEDPLIDDFSKEKGALDQTCEDPGTSEPTEEWEDDYHSTKDTSPLCSEDEDHQDEDLTEEEPSSGQAESPLIVIEDVDTEGPVDHAQLIQFLKENIQQPENCENLSEESPKTEVNEDTQYLEETKICLSESENIIDYVSDINEDNGATEELISCEYCEEDEIVDSVSQTLNGGLEIADAISETEDYECALTGNGSQIVENESQILDSEADIADKESQILDDESQIAENKTKLEGNESDILANEFEIVGNESNLLGNESQCLENQLEILDSESQIVQNESQIEGKESEILDDEPEIVGNVSNILDNEIQYLENQSEIVQNESQIDGKESEILDCEVEIVRNVSNILDNEIQSEIVQNESQIEGKESEILDYELEIVENESNILENESQCLENQSQILDSKSQIEGKESEILDYEPETVGNVSNILDNEIQCLENQSEIVQNESQIERKDSEILGYEEEIVGNVSNILDNESQCLENQSQILDSDSQIVHYESQTEGDELHILDNESQTVDNQFQIAENELQIDGNLAQFLHHAAHILQNESHTVEYELPRIKKESQMLENESNERQTVHSESEILRSESQTVKNESQIVDYTSETVNDKSDILDNESQILQILNSESKVVENEAQITENELHISDNESQNVEILDNGSQIAHNGLQGNGSEIQDLASHAEVDESLMLDIVSKAVIIGAHIVDSGSLLEDVGSPAVIIGAHIIDDGSPDVDAASENMDIGSHTVVLESHFGGSADFHEENPDCTDKTYNDNAQECEILHIFGSAHLIDPTLRHHFICQQDRIFDVLNDSTSAEEQRGDLNLDNMTVEDIKGAFGSTGDQNLGHKVKDEISLVKEANQRSSRHTSNKEDHKISDQILTENYNVAERTSGGCFEKTKSLLKTTPNGHNNITEIEKAHSLRVKDYIPNTNELSQVCRDHHTIRARGGGGGGGGPGQTRTSTLDQTSRGASCSTHFVGSTNQGEKNTENKMVKKKFKSSGKESTKDPKREPEKLDVNEVFTPDEEKRLKRENSIEGTVAKDSKKAPRLLHDIQAELFPDHSGNLKLFCHFGEIHADSTITWTKDSKLLARLHRSCKDDSPVSLAIVQTSKQDQGLYNCTLKNLHGKVSAEFQLTAEVVEQLTDSQDVEGGEEIEFNQLFFREDFITDMYFGGNLHGRIATEDLHFGEGVHRKAFRSKVMCGLFPVFNPGHLCVLKVHNAIAYGTKNNDELVQKNYKLAVQECYVQNTAREYAKIYAAEAEQLEEFGKVPEIIPIFLIHRPANNIPYATVEEELIGDFVKYSIKDGKEINVLRKDSEAGQKCCTFQHWVYERTNGNLLVTDMQGVGMKLTDVGIATMGKGYKGFKGNCSVSFIDQFKALHQCNKYCEILGLQSLRPITSKQKKPNPVKEKPQPNPPSSRKNRQSTKAKKT